MNIFLIGYRCAGKTAAGILLADRLGWGFFDADVELVKEAGKSIKEIVESDALISVAHFKGHELSGFGGTIKNLGMGCAARRGKLEQHSGLSPKVKKKVCIGCGDCIEHCAQRAISLSEDKAVIQAEKCVGCGECILICTNEAIDIQWK